MGASGGFAGPGVRLGAGLAGLAATAISVRRDRVGPREAQAFRMVNGLPDVLFLPSWPVMQLGNLVAAPASAGVAFLLGERRLARQVLIGGIASWSLSKVVKRSWVERPWGSQSRELSGSSKRRQIDGDQGSPTAAEASRRHFVLGSG